jgi:hypothetical protein
MPAIFGGEIWITNTHGSCTMRRARFGVSFFPSRYNDNYYGIL